MADARPWLRLWIVLLVVAGLFVPQLLGKWMATEASLPVVMQADDCCSLTVASKQAPADPFEDSPADKESSSSSCEYCMYLCCSLPWTAASVTEPVFVSIPDGELSIELPLLSGSVHLLGLIRPPRV